MSLYTNPVLIEEGGVWCLTPFSTIFHLYRGSHFYWTLENPEKITVIDKLHHIILHRKSTPRHEQDWNS
jgi:hypothetical protein